MKSSAKRGRKIENAIEQKKNEKPREAQQRNAMGKEQPREARLSHHDVMRKCRAKRGGESSTTLVEKSFYTRGKRAAGGHFGVDKLVS